MWCDAAELSFTVCFISKRNHSTLLSPSLGSTTSIHQLPPHPPPVDRITLKLGNKHNHNHELKYQSNDIKLPIITTCTHGIRNLRSCVYPAPQHTNTYTNKEVITSISMRKKPGKQMLTLFEKLKSFTAININPKSDMIKKYENIFVSLV